MVLHQLLRRFALPATAAYLLHWGLWALVSETEQIILSELTRILTWIADHSPTGFPRVEGVYWSAWVVAADAALEGLLPIAVGLLIGWWVLRKKGRIHSSSSSFKQ